MRHLTQSDEEVSRPRSGPWHPWLALAIAVTKALLVLLFFMHVRHSTRMTALTAVAGFFWLALLIGLTMADYASRGQILDNPFLASLQPS